MAVGRLALGPGDGVDQVRGLHADDRHLVGLDATEPDNCVCCEGELFTELGVDRHEFVGTEGVGDVEPEQPLAHRGGYRVVEVGNHRHGPVAPLTAGRHERGTDAVEGVAGHQAHDETFAGACHR